MLYVRLDEVMRRMCGTSRDGAVQRRRLVSVAVVNIVMFFPFTFAMSVPGIMNPFTKSPYLLSGATDSRNITNGHQGKRLLSLADRRPHPSSLPPPEPLARKRGWQPSSPEPSPAAAVTTSTTGHLNVHPASCNSTISPEARGEDQGSEMTNG